MGQCDTLKLMMISKYSSLQKKKSHFDGFFNGIIHGMGRGRGHLTPTTIVTVRRWKFLVTILSLYDCFFAGASGQEKKSKLSGPNSNGERSRSHATRAPVKIEKAIAPGFWDWAGRSCEVRNVQPRNR